MALSTRQLIGLVIGVFMLGLGVWLLARPFFPPGHPVTMSRFLDLAFAAFFLVRGAMNVRSALRPHRQEPPR